MDVVFLDGFWKLSTTRRFEGAPIPWDMITSYIDRSAFDAEVAMVFERMVWALDQVFIKHTKPGKPGKGITTGRDGDDADTTLRRRGSRGRQGG